MKISALPLEALISKLRSTFNTNLANVAEPVYGVKPFEIEFPLNPYSKNTKSFLLGQLRPSDVDSFGATEINKLVMYVDQSSNLNLEKPRDFSGVVIVALDFHLQWKSNSMQQNLEGLSLAVEDAVAESIQGYTQQNWGAGVVYNGQFSCIRGALAVPDQGQGSLRQIVAFRLQFQIDT